MKNPQFLYAFFAILLCTLLFSVRSTVICFIARCYLGYSTWSVTYADATFGKTLDVYHITLETQDRDIAIHIPECSIHWFAKTPTIHVKQPTVIIRGEAQKNTPWVERILHSALPSLPLHIDRANCKWLKQNTTADFILSYDATDPKVPYASLNIQEKGEQPSQMAFRVYYCNQEILLDSEFNQLNLNWLDSVVQMLPNCHWNTGFIDGQCWLALDTSHHITKCMAHLHLENLNLLQEEEHLELACMDSTLYVTYPTIEQKISPQFWYQDLVVQGDLVGGSVLMKHSQGDFPVAITDIQGKIDINFVKQSKLLLEGSLDYQGEISPFCLAVNPSEYDRGGILDFDVMLLLDPNLYTTTNLALSVVAEDNHRWHVKGKMQDLGVAQLSVFQHLLGLGVPSVKELHLQSGLASCEMSMYFTKGACDRLSLDYLEAKDLEIAWPKKGISASCCSLKTRAQLETLSFKEQIAPSWDFTMKQGTVCIENPLEKKIFTDVGMDLSITNHLWEHSSIRCMHKGIHAEILFEGSHWELDMLGQIYGHADDVLSLIAERDNEFQNFAQDTLQVNIKAHLGLEETQCNGDIIVKSADGIDNMQFSCDLDIYPWQWEQPIALTNVNRGTFKTEEISCRMLQMVQAYFTTEVEITGRLALEGSFNRDTIDCQIATPMFSFTSPLLKLDMPHRFSHVSKGHFHYDVHTQNITASLPVEQAFCREMNTGLEFQDIQALFSLQGPWIHIQKVQTESNGLIIEGEMSYQYACEPKELRVQVDRLLGTVSQCNHLIANLPSFGQFTIPMDGTLVGEVGALHFTSIFPEGGPEHVYDIHIHLQHGAMEVAKNLRLGDLAFDVSYDSQRQNLLISHVQGTLISPYLQEKMHVRGREIAYNEGRIFFDIGIENTLLDILYCKGHYNSITGCCVLDKEQTHFLDQKFTSFIGHWDPSKGLRDCEIGFVWDSDNFLRALSCISAEYIPRYVFPPSIDQDILCNFSLQNELWDIQLVGDTINVHVAETEKDHYTIYSCNWDEVLLGGKIYTEGTKLIIEELRASYDQSHYVCHDGVYDIANQIGNLPFSYYIETHIQDSIPILFQGEGVLEANRGKKFPQLSAKVGVDAKLFTEDIIRVIAHSPCTLVLQPDHSLEIVNAHLEIHAQETFQLLLDKAKIDIAQRLCTTASGRLDGAQSLLNMLIDQGVLNEYCRAITIAEEPYTAFCLDLQPNGYTTSITIPEMQYNGEGHTLQWTQALCTLDMHGDFSIVAQILLYGTPFSIHAQLRNNDLQTLKVQAYYNERSVFGVDMDLATYTIHKLVGDVFGLQFAFYPEFTANTSPYQSLQGNICIEAKKLSAITSEDVTGMIRELGLHKGISLQGTLQIPEENPLMGTNFQGWLQGSNFDLLGYQFRTLSGGISITPGEVILSDICVSDEGVQGTIPEWTASFREGDWHLQIPHLQLRNLRPSILKKPDLASFSVKPFIIKELNIQDITGVLSNPDTLVGKGHLVFTNTFKEGHHLIDIPMEIISRLGLDMVLLVPIYGELEYVLKDGKIQFTKLKNSHSENKRSYFYLANHRGESFVDLKGNLHMDIKMKQYVLFKITEFFILSLDGPLDNPSVFLRT